MRNPRSRVPYSFLAFGIYIGVVMAGCSPRSIPASPLTELNGVRTTSASSSERVLYSFKPGGEMGPYTGDGSDPVAGLVAVDGKLYGTTMSGGAHQYGSVFEVTTSGKERVVYSFKGAPDGAAPMAGLIFANGVLYGTTFGGGTSTACDERGIHGCGTVFSLTTSGADRILYSFKGRDDGANPVAGVIRSNGKFYGTTESGGGYTNGGTVFELIATGKERVLHSFKSYPDGSNPQAGLVSMNGVLYGTTKGGGNAFSDGIIFEVNPSSGAERVLFDFQDYPTGANPGAGLTVLNGVLYGTAAGAGAGTVYDITSSAVVGLVYAFTGPPDGALPEAGLVPLNGVLYGTTIHGGDEKSFACYPTSGCGTVFGVTASGKEAVLHRFTSGKDGAFPVASLAALNGKLYGTTEFGGAHKSGTVFAVTP
jgi:uncharacterized repeat protein (TIGR03803 family)